MLVLLYGASGNVGGAIAAELLNRGHEVTAVTRTGEPAATDRRLTVTTGDVTDANSVAKFAAGCDAVISAIGPNQPDDSPDLLRGAAVALVGGLREAEVRRLIVVGGAGSLEASPGQQLMDMPTFPTEWRATALAHRDALDVYRGAQDLDWTYVSPAAQIGPGERIGAYRRGGSQLIVDDEGVSRISYADFAIAIVDELEEHNAPRQRITVAY